MRRQDKSWRIIAAIILVYAVVFGMVVFMFVYEQTPQVDRQQSEQDCQQVGGC